MKSENPVVWFEIYVDNMKRAKKFYETVFQVELTVLPNPLKDDTEMMSFPMNMDTNNRASGSLVCMKGFKAGNNSTIVYFMSEDCSIEEARVKGAGGEIFKSKMSIGEFGNMVLAKDTEGNMIGIHSMK